jgi:creatinine amidohydrolase
MADHVPPEPTPGIRVARVSWPVLEAQLIRGAVAVLPVGAASKEHGRHLPMNTDLVQAEWLANRLLQQANVAVWPTVGYGYYPAFVDYPGSTSLTKTTFTDLVVEILGAIRHAGAQRVLLLNTGISTIEPLEAAIGRETSIMLAIAPEKVDMSRAVACSGAVIHGRLQRADPRTPGYSPSGVYGDPTLASADKGHRLVDAMLADVLAEFESIHAR